MKRIAMLVATMMLAACGGQDAVCASGDVACDGTRRLMCERGEWTIVEDCTNAPHPIDTPVTCRTCSNVNDTTCAPAALQTEPPAPNGSLVCG